MTIRASFRRSTSVALAGVLLAWSTAAAQQTRVITGVVIDRETSAPVAQALLRIQNSQLQTVSGSNGAFRLAVPIGRYVLQVEHIAYGSHTDTVIVTVDRDVRIQIEISRQAIQLTPLLVETQSDVEQRRRSTGASFNEVRREQIEEAQQKGFNLGELLRDGMRSVRVSGERRGGSYCVEYRGGTFDNQAVMTCRAVAVYVDDVRVGAPSNLYSTMPLRDIERIEMLSPAEAGTRYGISGGRGVLLIETRQGLQARRRDGGPTVVMATLDWSLESQPYRWAKVAGSSVVGNAVGLGLSLLIGNQCLELDTGIQGLRSKCDAFSTVGTGFIVLALPGVAGSYAAGWAGETDRSKGRMVPSVLLSTLNAAAGYLLYIHGESNNSEVTRTAGTLMLTVGTPLLTTISDRMFRRLR